MFQIRPCLILPLLQENPACTKNNHRDKLLLTSLADQIENTRIREKLDRNRIRGTKIKLQET
jgi:hypothetical protein